MFFLRPKLYFLPTSGHPIVFQRRSCSHTSPTGGLQMDCGWPTPPSTTHWCQRWKCRSSPAPHTPATWSITTPKQVCRRCPTPAVRLRKFNAFSGVDAVVCLTPPRCLHPKSNLTDLLSCWPLQAGEENPVVHLSVVSLNGPLHTVAMKKPDDPRIG